mgnify:CR=1 FL=1
MNSQVKKIKDAAKEIIQKKNDEIKLLKSALTKANGEKAVVFKMPDSLEVQNFPKIQKVKIEDLPKTFDVNVLNQKETKFPDVQKVLVVNESEIKNASSKDGFNGNGAMAQVAVAVVKGLSNLWATLWAKGLTVKLDDEERLKPLPVIVVDTLGRPVVQQSSQTIIPLGFNRSSGSADLTAVEAGLQTINSLVPSRFDYISLSYDSNDNVTGVVYKLGGSSGSTVSTLTLAYDSNDNVTSVTKT